jgi:DNA-binding transcriptional MerR regulator
MNELRTFTLDQLASLAEVPRRTVRYYIQSGLIDPPQGAGKGAYYTRQHVEQLLHVRKWQLAGLSLERIKELREHPAGDAMPPTPRRAGTVEVWSHLVVADGIEVILDPGRAGLAPEKVREFFRAVTLAYRNVQKTEEKE